jgi:anti-anti-sigma regulatory factor
MVPFETTIRITMPQSTTLPARNPQSLGHLPPLPLPPRLDLTQADALHGELQCHLAQDEAIRIDGSAVELVSTACVQLLVAVAVTAHAHGRTFELMAPSRILSHAARDLGLSACLGLTVA